MKKTGTARQQHEVINVRHINIRTSFYGSKPRYAVCVDTRNAGGLEDQFGDLHYSKRSAVALLRTLPYTGQVVRVMPSGPKS